MLLVGGANTCYDLMGNHMLMNDGCLPSGGMMMGTSAGEDLDFGNHQYHQNGSDINLN